MKKKYFLRSISDVSIVMVIRMRGIAEMNLIKPAMAAFFLSLSLEVLTGKLTPDIEWNEISIQSAP